MPEMSRATSAGRENRLVVSLATIPSRIGRLTPVIDSIKAQTRKPDRIYVCICEFCEWERSAYDVPTWLLEDTAIRVCVAPRDYGPANKLLGVLPAETSPTTRIVIVDDDWLCNRDLLEGLELRFGPDARTAIGLSGARVPRKWSRMEVRIGSEIKSAPPLPWRLTFLAEPAEDVSVDILQFGFGAMVLRGWFADDIYAMVESHQPWFFADDVLFSGYLEQKGVRRTCVSGMRLPRTLEHAKLNPLSGDGRMTKRYRAAIPTISAMLDIWRPDELAASFPRTPTFADLRYWSLLALRKGGRIARRAVSRMSGQFGLH